MRIDRVSTFLMRVTIFMLGVVAFFAQAQALTYIEPLPMQKKACDISIQECVKWFSKEYGVSYEKLDYIVKNESSYNEKALGDMHIVCPRTGGPVRSRGILQISTCYYPQIPDSCAFNSECALATMINLIKDNKSCKSQWTTCRAYN